MRELLFRGQTRRKGEKVRMGDGMPLESNWVYGGVFPNNNGGDFAVIYSQEPVAKHVVWNDTVCQYIGKNDKKGTRIFENDIVKMANGEIALIKWHDRYACWCFQKNGEDVECFFSEMFELETCEVIGNIFDNPELFANK